jgi:hypothetical protein
VNRDVVADVEISDGFRTAPTARAEETKSHEVLDDAVCTFSQLVGSQRRLEDGTRHRFTGID